MEGVFLSFAFELSMDVLSTCILVFLRSVVVGSVLFMPKEFFIKKKKKRERLC